MGSAGMRSAFLRRFRTDWRGGAAAAAVPLHVSRPRFTPASDIHSFRADEGATLQFAGKSESATEMWTGQSQPLALRPCRSLSNRCLQRRTCDRLTLAASGCLLPDSGRAARRLRQGTKHGGGLWRRLKNDRLLVLPPCPGLLRCLLRLGLCCRLSGLPLLLLGACRRRLRLQLPLLLLLGRLCQLRLYSRLLLGWRSLLSGLLLRLALGLWLLQLVWWRMLSRLRLWLRLLLRRLLCLNRLLNRFKWLLLWRQLALLRRRLPKRLLRRLLLPWRLLLDLGTGALKLLTRQQLIRLWLLLHLERLGRLWHSLLGGGPLMLWLCWLRRRPPWHCLHRRQCRRSGRRCRCRRQRLSCCCWNWLLCRGTWQRRRWRCQGRRSLRRRSRRRCRRAFDAALQMLCAD